MASPFPGMDPYLEHPRWWPDVHNALIAELRRLLGPLVRPKYRIRLEERIGLEAHADGHVRVPDLTVETTGEGACEVREPAPPYGHSTIVAVPSPDGVRETWLEVQDAATGEIVTALEILSPSNKKPGPGRAAYEGKRLAVFASRTNLVEIDLLRAGAPMPLAVANPGGDYRILVSRADQRPRATLHWFSVRQELPRFVLPLRAGDAEPDVPLRSALEVAYDTGSYDLCIDYRREAAPPLGGDDAAWADALLRQAGKR